MGHKHECAAIRRSLLLGRQKQVNEKDKALILLLILFGLRKNYAAGDFLLALAVSGEATPGFYYRPGDLYSALLTDGTSTAPPEKSKRAGDFSPALAVSGGPCWT